MDTQDARQQLEQMIREIDSTTQVLLAEGEGEAGEISNVDQHPADAAGEITDGDNQNAMLENNADRKAQVVAALQRIEDGTYGSCIDCGEQIPAARLDVRPEAARCMADQEKAEAAGLA